MAIKLKRGLEATIPTLREGEPGFTTDSKKLFIGSNAGNIEIGGGNINATPLVEVTWQELKDKRDLGLLTPGAQYRITDYVTTTVQENTRSAGHQFDIIVTADDVNKLNENARAAVHKKELLPWFEHSASDTTERYFYVDSVVIEGLTLYRWVSYEELNNGDDSQYLLTDTREVGIGDVVWGYQIIDDSEIYDTHSNYEEGDEQPRTIINVGEGYMPGYDYFYNSKLEAWKLKYCLDNDTSRFAWADSVNGKGVIYRMIDEFNNDVPYDFKNIQFKRKITDGQYDPVSGVETWCYTFTGISYEYSTLIDGTILKASEYFTDEGSNLYKNNKIGIYEYKRFEEDGYDKIIQQCNNIVFIGSYDEEPYTEEGPAKLVLFSFNNVFGAQCSDMTFGANCRENNFGADCSSNTFGDYCYSNTFGNDCFNNNFGAVCSSNTFGNDCSSNTFGDYCYSNTFGDYCYSNTFGNDCFNNTFGNLCSSNTFGNDCFNNTFDKNCFNNTFGNLCSSNTFGNDCRSNTFGNLCSSNTFGNLCSSNTFDKNCSFNTFGNGCYYSTFGNNCFYNTFGNGCYYLKISDNTGTQKRYISVDNGVQGASSANKFDLYDPAILNKDYQVTFKKSAGGKYLMLWATDTGTMTGKVKDSNVDDTWEDIV